MPSNNIRTIKTVTKILGVVAEDITLLAFNAIQLYKKTLEQYYYPNGTHTYLVILYDVDINQFLLNTEMDFSNFTDADIHSPEFQEMLDAFVLCIGITFDRYKKISSTFIKSDVIKAITRQLIMEFSE